MPTPPIPDDGLVFQGKTPNEIAKFSADALPKEVPMINRLAYQNHVVATRTARNNAIAELAKQHPDATPVLQQLLDQLHAPGNSDQTFSRRAIKHYAGLMSADAGTATREHFDRADVKDAIWPPKKRTSKKNGKAEAAS